MIEYDVSNMAKLGIPVAFAPDDNFVSLTVISMLSIVQNTEKDINFIILYSSLSKKSFETLNYVKNYKNCNITYKQIDEKIFDGFQNAHWVTIQAYFRTLLPDLFPSLDKIIYLDGDTMLRGDIEKFYNIDMTDYYLAAALECVNENNVKRLQLKNGSYFNSGVLLINCKKWREENLFDAIKDCAVNNKLVIFGDQDALNIVFDEKNKMILSGNVIYIQTWFWDRSKTLHKSYIDADFKKDKKEALIVHFTDKKPNMPQCNHSMKNEWWQTVKDTPFYVEFMEKYQKAADEYIVELYNKSANSWR